MSVKFIFRADIKFEAEDLDEAFSLLHRHFEALVDTDGDEEDDTWFLGEMKIEPEEEQ